MFLNGEFRYSQFKHSIKEINFLMKMMNRRLQRVPAFVLFKKIK